MPIEFKEKREIVKINKKSTTETIGIMVDKEKKRSMKLEVKDFLISEETRAIEAIQKLDTLAKKTLFIVKENQLMATLTDGDIRRWILKGGDLEIKVKAVANYSPKFLREAERRLAQKKMREWGIEAVPVLNEKKEISSIILWNHQEIRAGHGLSIPAVIMAGGYGTRLYPYTKILPKPLIPVGEIPIVEHILNRFHSFGIKDFHLVVNHKKNMIKAYFNEIEKNYQLFYVEEEKPLGTGGGISLLKGKINTTFFLSNCDILIEADYEEIYEHHKRAGNIITMICASQNIKIPYGVVETDEKGNILQMREKPELSFLTNTGFYLVEPKVIEDLPENQAIGFPEIIEKYQREGQNIGVYTIAEKAWLDMGQPDEMDKMLNELEIKDE